ADPQPDAPWPRSPPPRRAPHSARSMGRAAVLRRRAAPPPGRFAPWRPTSSSCRDRCRSRAAAEAVRAPRPVRRSGKGPSVCDLGVHRLEIDAELRKELELPYMRARLGIVAIRIERASKRRLEPARFLGNGAQQH